MTHPDGQAFSDEDLKRLKEQCFEHKHQSCCDLTTLINRLEAAEAYIKFDHRNWVEGGPKQEALYEAWRKAAGK